MPKKAKATKSNLKHLREAIGKHFGQNSVGRDYFAKLIGASPGSVVLWEKGKAPSDKFTAKLSDLAKKVSSGDLKGLPIPPKRGRQAGSKAKNTTGAKRAKVAKAVRHAAVKNGRWSATELARALLEFAATSREPKSLIEAARTLLS
jgi:hypothetical protein